jgi:formylglycine-generating enzyme required for sulfatase activity
MELNKKIKVFIASPSDVEFERGIVRETCEALNKNNLIKSYGILFEATGWEDVFPSPGRPQEIINRLIAECDIFICIFHKKFGSSTGTADSGTLEEFLLAYDSWKACKKPHIMFYFKEAKVGSLSDLKDVQFIKVLELKEHILSNKLLLFNEFSTSAEFREKITDHFEQWIVGYTKNWEKIGDQIEQTFNDDKRIKTYMQYALNEHRFLPTQGFETALRLPIELERVFINMHARIHFHDQEFTISGKNRMESRIREEELAPLDIRAAFEVSGRRAVKDLVILGDPGSGKTTLLKYVLVSLIQGKGDERLGIRDHIIPFLAPLRKLKNPEKDGFIDFLMATSFLDDCVVSKKTVSDIIENGSGIILLDGLDEVADEKTRVMACQWIDRARKKYTNTRFVITSRYAGYIGRSRLEGNVLELSIRDFTINEAREFLTRWFEAVEMALHPTGDMDMWSNKGKKEASLLVERIERSEHLRQLAVNPLLLQIIALVHKDRGMLPQRRVELYDECTNVLLEKWDMAKGLDILLSAREAKQILQPLALWLHEEEGRRSAPLEEVKNVIKAPLDEIGKSKIDPEALLLNIRDRSGIFMGYSEKEYGFTHLSFQEYLSAEEIRNTRQFQSLISNYDKRWWREVILLSLALNNPSMIEEFIEHIIPTEHFISDINLTIDALHDSIKKPVGPLIAALNNKDLIPQARYNAIRLMKEIGGDKVFQTLVTFLKHEDKKLAIEAYEALKHLYGAVGVEKPILKGVPEKFFSPIDCAEMALIPAGTFLFGSRDDDKLAFSNEKPQRIMDLPAFYMDIYPVTNERYCTFLNERNPSKKDLERWIDLEGGYEKEKCRIQKGAYRYKTENGYEMHPVILVSWDGANEYAIWAKKKLPSEQEWEKAARGLDGRIYPWGNEFDKKICNTIESGISGTTKVTSYPNGKSQYGCYEMAGNVMEWTSSFYDDKDKYVLRGGSWLNNADFCRCAYREGYFPDDKGSIVGFRCARTVTL